LSSSYRNHNSGSSALSSFNNIEILDRSRFGGGLWDRNLSSVVKVVKPYIGWLG